ncbi:hypothetical protein GCM10010975_33250 [Comamonas phosphati]|nr:hypothetical protein GCM10010975_33250 [Comamonas phosphati]
MSPRNPVALGLGCDRGTPVDTLRSAVESALALAGVGWHDVVAAASITLKSDEIGLLALAAERGWRLAFYEPGELAAVPVPHPSATVLRYTGTPSVSEAAALLAAGQNQGQGRQPAPIAALCVEKHKWRGADGKNATVSVARLVRAGTDSEPLLSHSSALL